MGGPLALVERGFAVLVLMAFAGTILPGWLASGAVPTGETEDGRVLILFATLYAGILAALAARPRIAVRLAVLDPLVTALVALALISAVWSIEPGVTLRRAVAFGFTTLFALYLWARFGTRGAVILIAVALSILTVLSIAAVFVLPAVGVDHTLHAGAWKGVYFQKNVAGRATVVLILCLLWLGHVGAPARPVRAAMLATAFLFLVMSGSGTGFLVALLVVAILGGVRRFGADVGVLMPVAVLAAFVVFVGAGLLAVFTTDALGLLGRDPTLTGRTELWEHTLRSVMERPWLGWGYAAYWYGTNGPAAAYTIGWGIASAHNGVIDAALDLGLTGVLPVLAMIGRGVAVGAARARYGDPDGSGAFALAVTLAMTAISLSESVFLERHALTWVVFVTAAAALAGRRPAGAVPSGREGRFRHDIAA